MTPTLLMCEPSRFEVSYVINPWMLGNINSSKRALAARQWGRLHRALARHAEVRLIEPVAGCPDMVFTANAGLVLGERVVLARFRHGERRGEERYFGQWFKAQGFEAVSLPPDISFEGAGDALLDRAAPIVWMGHGFRTDERAAAPIAAALAIEVVPLRLVDPRFYHLDTCLCPLARGEVLYYPAAFDAESRRRIETLVPAHARIAVGEDDARDFACNAVNLGEHLFLNRASPQLLADLGARGYRVALTPLTEFMKAGGSAKCLTLRLDEQQPQRAAAAA